MPQLVREILYMNKKKKAILGVSVCIVLVLTGIVVFILKYRSKDHINFAELDLSKVDSIAVCSYSMEQVILSEEEVTELLLLLNQVELVGEWSQEFLDYVGGTNYMFQINLINGKSFGFAADIFYIIDGERGYKVEESNRHVSYELSQKYFALIDQYFY